MSSATAKPHPASSTRRTCCSASIPTPDNRSQKILDSNVQKGGTAFQEYAPSTPASGSSLSSSSLTFGSGTSVVPQGTLTTGAYMIVPPATNLTDPTRDLLTGMTFTVGGTPAIPGDPTQNPPIAGLAATPATTFVFDGGPQLTLTTNSIALLQNGTDFLINGQTFELRSDGQLAAPPAFTISFNQSDSVSTFGSEIVNAVNNANIGVTASFAGNRVMFLNSNPGLTDLSAFPKQLFVDSSQLSELNQTIFEVNGNFYELRDDGKAAQGEAHLIAFTSTDTAQVFAQKVAAGVNAVDATVIASATGSQATGFQVLFAHTNQALTNLSAFPQNWASVTDDKFDSTTQAELASGNFVVQFKASDDANAVANDISSAVDAAQVPNPYIIDGGVVNSVLIAARLTGNVSAQAQVNPDGLDDTAFVQFSNIVGEDGNTDTTLVVGDVNEADLTNPITTDCAFRARLIFGRYRVR